MLLRDEEEQRKDKTAASAGGKAAEAGGKGEAAARPEGTGSLLRELPAVGSLLEEEELVQLAGRFSHQLVASTAREVLAEMREEIRRGARKKPLSAGELREFAVRETARRAAEKASPRLQRAVNATGVVLHTNLGRAPLGEAAKKAVKEAAGYCSLEIDLASGERGSRHEHVRELLCFLTGAEDALAVNNNAGAVLLILSALARGREVIISRGQLVEIGGGFRVPEVLLQSGAHLVEVGTTNRTYLSDYERAISERTALLMRVHTSNYRLVGFSHETSLAELVELGRRYGLPVVDDLGSGALIDLRTCGLPYEPYVQESVQAGADLVAFSGDKLLGGPQAGIIVGRKVFIDQIKKHPLMRALRIDKLTLAALTATLAEYLSPAQVLERVPVLRMLTEPDASLRKRADFLAERLQEGIACSGFSGGVRIEVLPDFSPAGGGSLPGHMLPTWAVGVKASFLSAAAITEKLRQNVPPVIARVREEQVIFDVRTLWEEDLAAIDAAWRSILAEFSRETEAGGNAERRKGRAGRGKA